MHMHIKPFSSRHQVDFRRRDAVGDPIDIGNVLSIHRLQRALGNASTKMKEPQYVAPNTNVPRGAMASGYDLCLASLRRCPV